MTSGQPDDYQIRVHVIEARQLRGADGDSFCNPIAKVALHFGKVDREKWTEKKEKTSSAYWDETKLFTESLSRQDFEDAKLSVTVEDASGFIKNRMIGKFLLDVTTVYDKEGHELFGQWVVLLNPDEGSTVQGFLRVSVAVLRTSSGDEYVLHKPEDLDEQDEGDMSMVMGAPQIETKSVKLTINVYRVELAKYQLSMPEARRRPPAHRASPLAARRSPLTAHRSPTPLSHTASRHTAATGVHPRPLRRREAAAHLQVSGVVQPVGERRARAAGVPAHALRPRLPRDPRQFGRRPPRGVPPVVRQDPQRGARALLAQLLWPAAAAAAA